MFLLPWCCRSHDRHMSTPASCATCWWMASCACVCTQLVTSVRGRSSPCRLTSSLSTGGSMWAWGVLCVTSRLPRSLSDYAVECGCGQGPAACAVEEANQSLLSRRGSTDKGAGPDPPVALPLSTRKRRRTTSSLNSPNSSHPGGVGSTNEVSAHVVHLSHCTPQLTLQPSISHTLAPPPSLILHSSPLPLHSSPLTLHPPAPAGEPFCRGRRGQFV